MSTVELSRRRLETLEDLSGLVHTMKALAAVSIRQYEVAVGSLEAYYRAVELGLHAVLREMRASTTARGHRRQLPGVAAVVFGSDHGLCGRFNEDMADYAAGRLKEVTANGEPLRVLAIGARLASLLEATGRVSEDILPVPASAPRITTTVRQILLRIEQWEASGAIGRVYLLYNRPIRGGRFHPAGVQLLPVDLHRFRRLEEAPWPTKIRPMFTQQRDELLAALLRQYFFVSLFRACAESLAVEHTSRLAAMQSAERNLEDKREALLADYRRERQGAITSELLDLVGGYEALRQSGERSRDGSSWSFST